MHCVRTEWSHRHQSISKDSEQSDWFSLYDRRLEWLDHNLKNLKRGLNNLPISTSLTEQNEQNKQNSKRATYIWNQLTETY